MDFDQYVFSAPYFFWLCRGVLMTLSIALVSGVGAAAVGFAMLRCHISAVRPLHWAAAGFVIAFRNLPLVPLLLFLVYGMPGVWYQLSGHAFPRGTEVYLLLLGLVLNTGAYIAEILRAGVEAIAPEQVEAARTLGLPRGTIRRRVIYPQAARIMAPALATRFIHNTKNSAIALVVPLPVGMMEVVGQAGRIAGQTFSWAEPLIFAACVHLSLALGLGWFLNHWAAREQARVEGA